MKKYFIMIAVMLCGIMTSCRDYDDFDFEGTVVGYRYCSSIGSVQDLGYFVKLDSPDSVGGSVEINGVKMDNVLVVYQSDRMLRNLDHIHGRLYLEPKYSKANCSVHATDVDKDLPEAVFTKIVRD